MNHSAIIGLIISYCLVTAFVFVVAASCLALVGVITFPKEKQQKTLFNILIVQIIAIGVGYFSGLLQLDPSKTEAAIIKQNALATRDSMIADFSRASARYYESFTELIKQNYTLNADSRDETNPLYDKWASDEYQEVTRSLRILDSTLGTQFEEDWKVPASQLQRLVDDMWKSITGEETYEELTGVFFSDLLKDPDTPYNRLRHAYKATESRITQSASRTMPLSLSENEPRN